MKLLKKFTAILLTVMLVIGGAAISASAAVENPVFSLVVKSSDASSVTLELSLTKGSISSMDVRFDVSSPLGVCKEIKVTSEFSKLKSDYSDNYHSVTNASNINTRMFSMASSKPIDGPISILNVTFAKSGSGDIPTSAFNAYFDSCVVISGSQNVNVASKVQVVKSGGFITFSSDVLNGNYKDVKSINYTSSYGKEQIEWETSNAKVATVDDNGKVTMTGKGTATITAKSVDGTAEASCKVTVSYSSLQWIIIIVLFGWIWYV